MAPLRGRALVEVEPEPASRILWFPQHERRKSRPGWWVPLRGAGLLDCFGDRPLWLAQYPGRRDVWPEVDRLPTPMPPWDRAALWRWGDRLSLGGVALDGSLADDAGWARLVAG
jgi:hypothetical protein